jgi:hypothetical protein
MVVENFLGARNKHLAAESRGGNAKLPRRAGRVFYLDRETPARTTEHGFRFQERHHKD